MSSLKICRICLRTEARGYQYHRYQLRYYYEEVSAHKIADRDGLPQWFCYECAAMLHKFHKFKEKCYVAQKYLKEILWKGPITYEAIYKLDQAASLQSTLKMVTKTDKVKTFVVRDPELDERYEDIKKSQANSHKHSEINRLVIDRNQITSNNTIMCKIIAGEGTETDHVDNIDAEQIKIVRKTNSNFCGESVSDLDRLDLKNTNIGSNVNNITREINFGIDINKLSTETKNIIPNNDSMINFENVSNNDLILSSNTSNDPSSPISILVQGDKTINIKHEELKAVKSKNVELCNLKELGKFLSEEYWKKVILTEEEAVKEFRRKADDPKYLDAAYKCIDCFKGFSKKDMLSRHVQSRHSEELGGHECRFCRMRFKWRCHLRKHIQQHYTKYECLRCHVIFHLDTSALLHEEYHSGSVKKCLHCDEQFRHVTTYYTHMRTHRSAHVCVRCGASFVSRTGLRQHTKIKHPEQQMDSGSSESECDRESYCSRCDILFHSARAHTEHLFHSDMHTQAIKEEPDATTTKKIMGKRLREKITKDIRKRKTESDTTVPVKVKRRRRIKRKHRKPSTCYQCGEQFSTQAACMRHHVAAHPRTSFHSPTDRHICELCGASLAPGSVAVHQNMHSRERVHACDTCGRQFHSTVGLKRHLLTHTGEKPFACPLCEKRFTQSNSMKLHYRTFHLKQPYPKRIRKRKKDEPNRSTERDDTYGEESDSVPETGQVLAVAGPQPEVPVVLHAVGESGDVQEDMQYLTLN